MFLHGCSAFLNLKSFPGRTYWVSVDEGFSATGQVRFYGAHSLVKSKKRYT